MIVSSVDTIYQVLPNKMMVTTYKTLLDEDINKTYNRVSTYSIDLYNNRGEVVKIQSSSPTVDIYA